ncbi:MAG: hypothetical protein ACREDR_06285 [Blastocatellia bacterium]
MSIASEYSGFDWDNLLLPHDMWPSYFEEVFEASPDAAENMARVLYEIPDAIQSGSEGVAKTINTLKDGIEYAYRYTEAHKLGLRLYLFYLDGKLEIGDQPERVLSRAVERGVIATKKKESGKEEDEE